MLDIEKLRNCTLTIASVVNSIRRQLITLSVQLCVQYTGREAASCVVCQWQLRLVRKTLAKMSISLRRHHHDLIF